MSYLAWPRLHFTGRFQADTSTVNNDVRHYKSDTFLPQFQEPMVGQAGGLNERANGYWNPEGSGAWRMLGCRISGVATGPGLTPERSPETELVIAGADKRTAGKLVDLDPQQQMVSQIWGLIVALEDTQGHRLLDSEYLVSTFTDLWKRQQIMENFDQTLAASFQSQLAVREWGDLSAYPLLQALRDACPDGLLSMRFNAFGYDRDPTANDYTTGRIVGTIGPASADEPRHFCLGRQCVPRLANPANPLVPANHVYAFQGQVHAEARTLSVDLGHCLPVRTADGDFQDIGTLSVAVLKDATLEQGQCVSADQVAVLGPVGYRKPGWYARTAGVMDYDFSADPWVTGHIGDHPIALLKQDDCGGYKIMIRETEDGLYVRADQHVFRLNPGDPARTDLYATRYGQPTAMELKLVRDMGFMGGSGTAATLNTGDWPVPEVGKPEQALEHPATVSIDGSGRGTLAFGAHPAGPGNFRGYIDGQVYGLGYRIATPPEGYLRDFWNFISILIWDDWPVPETPTWHRDIQPIMEQYGNLYPIMSRHLVNLGDYDSVLKHLDALKLCFSLPVSDPNFMPVSRDLSANKLKAILHWMNHPGPDGKPLKGEPADREACAPPLGREEVDVAAELETMPALTAAAETDGAESAPDDTPYMADVPMDRGGKLDFLMQVMARNAAKGKE